MLNLTLNYFYAITKIVLYLAAVVHVGACSSSAQDKSALQVITGIEDSIAKSAKITIIHIDISDGGHLARTPQEIHTIANINLNLKCDYVCGNSFPTIVQSFTENTFYEINCEGSYSTILRLYRDKKFSDIVIGWYGHCVKIDEKSYIATTSVLNGLIGGFPDYLNVKKTYGMSPEEVIDRFKLKEQNKVYEPKTKFNRPLE